MLWSCNQEMLLFSLCFGILVISILIVGEIFFSLWRMMTICPLISLKMEQNEKGVISAGWLSSEKARFSQVCHCQLDSERRQLCQGTQDSGLAGSGIHQVDQQPHPSATGNAKGNDRSGESAGSTRGRAREQR